MRQTSFSAAKATYNALEIC